MATKPITPAVTPTAVPVAVKRHALAIAHSVGVPLLAFETSDPAQTMANCIVAINGTRITDPVFQWDCIRGLRACNQPAVDIFDIIAPDPSATMNPVACLQLLADYYIKAEAARTPAAPRIVCFYLNAQRYMGVVDVMQAMWNLRDVWKAHGSTLVLLSPTFTLPAELAHDVVVVTESLPTAAEIEHIVDRTLSGANIDKSKITDKAKVVDTLLGLSAFAAEQVTAMSLTREGFNQDELWERKRKMIEQTPGLSVWKDKGTFEDLGGLDNIKAFLTKLLTSDKNPVRCIAYIDEIEKLFAGAAGDLSGVSQDQLRTVLTEMQDNNIPGIILLGPAGVGKSQIAKSAGAIANAEVLSIDTGAMTGSLVGESQAKIRKAFQTLKAVSQGKALILATCNAIGSLPPELRRRFSLGTFFVDLPSSEERTAIWKIWLKKYGFDAASQLPSDEGWTGAEIRSCCDVAYRTNMSLVEASTFVVPICKSAADKIAALRQQASGKFISASKPGVYEYQSQAAAPIVATGARRITFDSK